MPDNKLPGRQPNIAPFTPYIPSADTVGGRPTAMPAAPIKRPDYVPGREPWPDHPNSKAPAPSIKRGF